jgi:hypothetical protein
MAGLLHKLRTILSVPFYRRLAVGIGALYEVMFLVALQDISPGGRGFQVLVAEWTRMFDRTGAFTFEPIAQVTVPGLTILLSPVNILIGLVLSVLAGLNLTVTWMAFRAPKACRFNRSTGIIASLPALLAGGACCAPAIILILGLQVSSLLITVFQVLIPVSVILLFVTLVAILRRTDTAVIAAEG